MNYSFLENLERFKKLNRYANTNVTYDPLFSLDEQKAKIAIGEPWWSIFNYYKTHNVKVRNIVAITCKSSLKTKATIKWFLYKMNVAPWLNAFIYRDTIDRAVIEMSQQVRDTIRILGTEYNVKDIFDKFEEVGTDNSINLVRKKVYKGKKVRDNQKISLQSFDEAVIKGGFTTANGFEALNFFEELQNPATLSKNHELLTREQFESEFKLIDSKNNEITLTTGVGLDPNEPRNFFMSNRYNDQFPLSQFAEEHFPWESTDEIKGVKEWMLEDPVKNNVAVHYVEKAKKGWEFLNNTLIVYMNKFSNHLLMSDPIIKEENIKLVKKGRPIDLAIILGDIFEGYDIGDFAYHYEKIQKIPLDVFEESYAKYITKVVIGVDRNFSRQIVAIPKYLMKVTWIENNKVKKSYRLIRGIPIVIKSNKVGMMGIPSEQKFNQFIYEVNKLKAYVKKHMPLCKSILIVIDNDGGEWVGRINHYDKKDDEKFIKALKVFFKKNFSIQERPKLTSSFQDSGFIFDIDNRYTTNLHRSYQSVRLNENGKRIKKPKDPWTDFWDADEYGNYLFKVNFKRFLNERKDLNV